MTVQPRHNAFLKHIAPPAVAGNEPSHHSLSTSQSTVIGRTPGCHIVLDSSHYKGVSRRHVEIRPLMAQSTTGEPQWQVCDLGSTNGTYVNGQRLQGCRTLKPSDSIRLGQDGPEFIFEYQSPLQSSMSAPRGEPPTILEERFPINPSAISPAKKTFPWKLLAGVFGATVVVMAIVILVLYLRQTSPEPPSSSPQSTLPE
jgi:hypothetical protein